MLAGSPHRIVYPAPLTLSVTPAQPSAGIDTGYHTIKHRLLHELHKKVASRLNISTQLRCFTLSAADECFKSLVLGLDAVIKVPTTHINNQIMQTHTAVQNL